MTSNVLIIALNVDWTGISRLPSGLQRAGFQVNALCPSKSFLAKTKFLNKSIQYPVFTYSRSKVIYLWMIFAIAYFKPELIIPGDEDTILALQRLAKLTKNVPFLKFVSNTVGKSLTPEQFNTIVLSKSEFQEKCRQWQVRSPKNIILRDVDEATTWARKLGYPVVLKHDSGYGGSGVFICENEADIRNHFLKFKKAGFLQKIKSNFKKFFFVSIFNQDNSISLQQFILGQVGQSPFCANKGQVFAHNPMLRLQTYPGVTGPATVSCGYENGDIKQFVQKVAKELNFTGFGSIEYIIEHKTGLLYAIEFNPRPTPTCHMTDHHVTNDLCQAFYNGVNGLPIQENTFRPYSITMFPGEKRRDPQSKYLSQGYHDVPVNDPALLLALDPAF